METNGIEKASAGSPPVPKVAVIGAGNVGAVAGYCVAKENIADVVFIDVVPGMPQAKAADLAGTAAVNGFARDIDGSNDYSALADAAVVIHTAGLPRKPGMDRMDLLKTNVQIARTAGAAIKEHAPNAIVIVVANPLDVITMAMYRATGFDQARVFGMAGTLDATRFRYFVAEKLDIWPAEVSSLVMGGHGDSMVPLPAYTTIAGLPVGRFLQDAQVSELATRTRGGGGEIVGHLKVGGAYYAPGSSAANIAISVITGQRRIEPVSAYLQGEYGHKDLFLGVPAVVGASGVERIIELPLDDTARKALALSVEHVRSGIRALESIDQE